MKGRVRRRRHEGGGDQAATCASARPGRRGPGRPPLSFRREANAAERGLRGDGRGGATLRPGRRRRRHPSLSRGGPGILRPWQSASAAGRQACAAVPASGRRRMTMASRSIGAKLLPRLSAAPASSSAGPRSWIDTESALRSMIPSSCAASPTRRPPSGRRWKTGSCSQRPWPCISPNTPPARGARRRGQRGPAPGERKGAFGLPLDDDGGARLLAGAGQMRLVGHERRVAALKPRMDRRHPFGRATAAEQAPRAGLIECRAEDRRLIGPARAVARTRHPAPRRGDVQGLAPGQRARSRRHPRKRGLSLCGITLPADAARPLECLIDDDPGGHGEVDAHRRPTDPGPGFKGQMEQRHVRNGGLPGPLPGRGGGGRGDRGKPDQPEIGMRPAGIGHRHDGTMAVARRAPVGLVPGTPGGRGGEPACVQASITARRRASASPARARRSGRFPPLCSKTTHAAGSAATGRGEVGATGGLPRRSPGRGRALACPAMWWRCRSLSSVNRCRHGARRGARRPPGGTSTLRNIARTGLAEWPVQLVRRASASNAGRWLSGASTSHGSERWTRFAGSSAGAGKVPCRRPRRAGRTVTPFASLGARGP